jgi:signal transduction histidine kinase
MEQRAGARLSALSGGRSLRELKNLEWIFIGIHSLGVPTAIVMAVMHKPSSALAVSVIAGLMAAWSAIDALLNHRIADIDRQVRLALATQVIAVLFAWALVFQVVSGENTAAYAGLTVVIIEGAVRFGLRGSLAMGIVFALGLIAAMEYREWEYGLPFNVPGYLFWAILSFFVALVVGLVTEENRRERRRREILVRQRTLLEERQRIARDLHDAILKTLHGLALEAHALKRLVDSPMASEKAAYIEDVCQGSTQEIRDIIAELRSEEEDEGIASLLSRMVKSWGETAGTQTEFAVSGDDRRLSLIASYSLRNVLAEALLNVQKHAGASRVSVSLELLPGELRLEISDNGKGIDYPEGEVYGVASRGKYGVLGMKERVEQLNGQLSIDGRCGTRLLISVPLVPDK